MMFSESTFFNMPCLVAADKRVNLRETSNLPLDQASLKGIK